MNVSLIIVGFGSETTRHPLTPMLLRNIFQKPVKQPESRNAFFNNLVFQSIDMAKDEVFKNPITQSADFKFDQRVVTVFDDMVTRSVPYYLEIQRMIGELAQEYARIGTTVYDLGCSTGTTMKNMDNTVDNKIKFIGVDDSSQMLKQCEENLKNSGMTRSIELLNVDLNRGIKIENASVVVLCLTLQFIRPLYRVKLLDQIRNGLVEGGCLILVEKLLAEEANLNRNFIKYYYDFKKRNNYSEMEIAQKREALENVLVPYKLSEDIDMLLTSGFSHCEVFFKWYNFAGMIAFK
jgi:tRNA (cmo5U34)-methyltransferase